MKENWPQRRDLGSRTGAIIAAPNVNTVIFLKIKKRLSLASLTCTVIPTKAERSGRSSRNRGTSGGGGRVTHFIPGNDVVALARVTSSETKWVGRVVGTCPYPEHLSKKGNYGALPR